MKDTTYIEAINEALSEEIERDVGHYGDVMQFSVSYITDKDALVVPNYTEVIRE